MAVSKKLRFDVFKRDLFTCQYCGRTPPTVVLEVDHIIPRKQAKNDNIDNLITSCFDCNRGKAAVPLTEAPEALANKVVILKEKREQLKAFDRFLRQQEERLQQQISEVQHQFSSYYPGWFLSERFCDSTLRRFLPLLTLPEIRRAMAIANGRHPENTTQSQQQAIKYFCGICWNWIKKPEMKSGYNASK